MFWNERHTNNEEEFFHVVIESNSEKSLLYKDLTKSDLKRKLVSPYKKNIKIFKEGLVVNPNDISSIKIISTREPHGIEIKNFIKKKRKDRLEFNRGSRLKIIGPVYGEELDIEFICEIVTDKFISEAPSENIFNPKKSLYKNSSKIIIGIVISVLSAIIIRLLWIAN